MTRVDLASILNETMGDVYNIQTHAAGPAGAAPLTPEMLLHGASGDIFGMSQNAGMGWAAAELARPEFLILSTSGGIRAEDGSPIALGYHTGHWEVGLLVRAAAEELRRLGTIPFAGFCTDPCDGRTQGTPGMMDSLAYRNDAAIVLRRLIRSLPRRRGVMGVATCDKGLPAMMMALAGAGDLPCILVPGGVTLPPTEGEDAGKVQSLGARYAHGAVTLEQAAEAACRTCATPGGGCQFLGTAATAQVVGEALGMSLPHSALAPSGQAVWLDMATRSARALLAMHDSQLVLRAILTPAALENAMTVHAAFGGSTNLLLHIPAIAHAAGLRRPTVDDWIRINRKTPRLVDALPNGPVGHVTVRVFLAGGVPEVMLHLRELGLLDLDCMTASGQTVNQVLDWWQTSERRHRMRQILIERDGIDPDDVIIPPQSAKAALLNRTVSFPRGNLAPEGSVIKSTAIDPSVVGPGNIFRHLGPAKVFTTQVAAMEAIKSGGVVAGDVLVLICRGPSGAGMEEVYQVTAALKHLEFGKHVAVITDARFSGVSTGACIGHVGPEALAGGPIGKVLDGDPIEIVIDLNTQDATVNFVGGDGVLASRPLRGDLRPDPGLPADTRLWAALQQASGGAWGGAVYDADAIIDKLKAK